jgi:hypothetical protein
MPSACERAARAVHDSVGKTFEQLIEHNLKRTLVIAAESHDHTEATANLVNQHRKCASTKTADSRKIREYPRKACSC